MTEQEQKTSSPQNRSPLWWVRVCQWIWKIAAGGVIFSVVLNIFSTWLTSPQGIIPATSPLGWLLHQWQVFPFLISFLFFLAFLTWIASRWPSPSLIEASSSSEALSLQQNRDRTLRRLHRIYDEWFTHSLQGVAPIDLGLAEKPDALHNAKTLLFRSLDQPERPLPTGTTVLDVYDLAEHELLILGEPGAGKSTLLQSLAIQLIARAESDPTHPLPVLLPLASWASKHLPLQDWLAEQLTSIYNIPPQLSLQWVEADMILPLLDGLDEVDPSARLACIIAINTFHLERFAVPLVICSRKTNYERAAVKRRLVLQRAVIVQPLTPEQIDTALVMGGRSLAALRNAFKKNQTLRELATTPLMLSVLMMTYQGVTIRALSTQGSQLLQQIWEDYVQRMVRSRGNTALYPLDDTKRWLGWLAREMKQHNQTTFSLEQLQPDWLPGKHRWLYWWVYRPIGGLLVGFFCGLLFELIGQRTLWIFFSQKVSRKLFDQQILGLSFAIGASTGLLFVFLSGQSTQRDSGAEASRITRDLKQNVVGILVLVLASTFCLVLTSSQLNDPLFLISIGLLSGTSLAGLFWLVGKLSQKWHVEEHTEFLRGFSQAFNISAQKYVLRFWLWRLHAFPWKARAFLDDSTTRILLRRVKGGYSFTHRLLLDYFADLNQ